MSKSSISVPELQKMLGLKRGAAYYLVRQGLFETVTVGGKIRVKLDSFETWYNGQFHYKKVDGPEPGQIYAGTISAKEVAAILGITSSGVLADLLKRRQFSVEWVNGHPRIDRASFEEWYDNQLLYHKVDGPEPGRNCAGTVSASEVAAMLGVHRNTVYDLLKKGAFEARKLNGHTRVVKDSFEQWYQGQTHYQKVEEREVS